MNHTEIVAQHRNKLMGEWAAAALRLSGSRAKGYVDNLLTLGDGSPEGRPILRKLDTDFAAAHIPNFRQIIRFKMQSLLEAAQYQLRGEFIQSRPAP